MKVKRLTYLFSSKGSCTLLEATIEVFTVTEQVLNAMTLMQTHGHL